MRPLKFRVWDKERERWVQTFDSIFDIWDHIICYQNNKLILTDDCYPVVIEQFTGILDSTGKEIYEGDIIEWLGYEVRDGKQIRPRREMEVVGDFFILSRLINIIENNHTVVIIGNIHEKEENKE